MTDTGIIIVGAGPTGLMLASELRLTGVRAAVLERQPQIRDIPKAGGLSGQILELLRYRGEPGERTLLHTRAQVALRRGHDPAADALRELFQELLVDEQPLRRIGALMAGSDIRYPPPGPRHHALAGTFAPDLTLTGRPHRLGGSHRRTHPDSLAGAARSALRLVRHTSGKERVTCPWLPARSTFPATSRPRPTRR